MNLNTKITTWPTEAEQFQPNGGCKEAGCRFCKIDEAAASGFPTLRGRSEVVQVPHVSRRFVVFQDAFPLGTQGVHLLISPRDHYRSLAQVPYREQLRATVNSTISLLEEMFPGRTLFVFEHGTGSLYEGEFKRGGNSVDHAHGHVVVLDRGIEFQQIRHLTEQEFRQMGWNLDAQSARTRDVFRGPADFTGGCPYIHIGGISSGQRVSYTYKQISVAQNIPSQLLRRLVATACGQESPSYWDWKVIVRNRIQARLDEFANLIDVFRCHLHDHLVANAA